MSRSVLILLVLLSVYSSNYFCLAGITYDHLSSHSCDVNTTNSDKESCLLDYLSSYKFDGTWNFIAESKDTFNYYVKKAHLSILNSHNASTTFHLQLYKYYDKEGVFLNLLFNVDNSNCVANVLNVNHLPIISSGYKNDTLITGISGDFQDVLSDVANIHLNLLLSTVFVLDNNDKETFTIHVQLVSTDLKSIEKIHHITILVTLLTLLVTAVSFAELIDFYIMKPILPSLSERLFIHGYYQTFLIHSITCSTPIFHRCVSDEDFKFYFILFVLAQSTTVLLEIFSSIKYFLVPRSFNNNFRNSYFLEFFSEYVDLLLFVMLLQCFFIGFIGSLYVPNAISLLCCFPLLATIWNASRENMDIVFYTILKYIIVLISRDITNGLYISVGVEVPATISTTVIIFIISSQLALVCVRMIRSRDGRSHPKFTIKRLDTLNKEDFLDIHSCICSICLELVSYKNTASEISSDIDGSKQYRIVNFLTLQSKKRKEVKEPTIMAVTVCNHIFHVNCIKQWLHTSQMQNSIFTCPICRKYLAE